MQGEGERVRARLHVEAVLKRALMREALRFDESLRDVSILTNFRRTNVLWPRRHESRLELLCGQRT